ncbi:MAG: response regulator [Caldicoprobacterales bacterium]
MYKILIVEDDRTISVIIEEKLNKWGYVTHRVKDFKDILIEFTSFKPHLVLMDINLPYYDGFYWCAKIRQLSNIPIISLLYLSHPGILMEIKSEQYHKVEMTI